VVATWSGLRPATADSLPYIAPLAPNAVVCAGHGSQGILTGAGSARLAVDLLLGRPPVADSTAFRLERPRA
jgi:glycine oxidase